MPGTNYKEAQRSRPGPLGAMPTVSPLLSWPQTLSCTAGGGGLLAGCPASGSQCSVVILLSCNIYFCFLFSFVCVCLCVCKYINSKFH